jgi:hypothetical protein
MDIPMLDDEEFEPISRLYSECIKSTKEHRKKYGLPLSGVPVKQLFSPVCEAYSRLTGFEETSANAIMHHRISLYGPPCPQCGKPFRTPKASFCAACGFRPE